jgi:hypothetical protein
VPNTFDPANATIGASVPTASLPTWVTSAPTTTSLPKATLSSPTGRKEKVTRPSAAQAINDAVSAGEQLSTPIPARTTRLAITRMLDEWLVHCISNGYLIIDRRLNENSTNLRSYINDLITSHNIVTMRMYSQTSISL